MFRLTLVIIKRGIKWVLTPLLTQRRLASKQMAIWQVAQVKIVHFCMEVRNKLFICTVSRELGTMARKVKRYFKGYRVLHG